MEQHVRHLERLFEKLSANGLVLNPTKCQFGVAEIDFLGHHVTSEGATPLHDRVLAIQNFPQPLTNKSLEEFLGMVNFYHRFIPSAAQLMQPLFSALTGLAKHPKVQQLSWSDNMVKAFTSAKKGLADATLLTFPRESAPTALTVDASDLAVGGVLEQFVDGHWRPLSFFSRQLRVPEQKYSAFDRELLALYLAIRHFQYFLE